MSVNIYTHPEAFGLRPYGYEPDPLSPLPESPAPTGNSEGPAYRELLDSPTNPEPGYYATHDDPAVAEMEAREAAAQDPFALGVTVVEAEVR